MKISQCVTHFFNFAKNSPDPEIQNPCDNPKLRKLFRAGKPTQPGQNHPLSHSFIKTGAGALVARGLNWHCALSSTPP